MELLHRLSKDSSNQQILKVVLDEDELSWQHIIYDLVKSERMDPWDIDLRHLTEKFLEVIRKLQELDFRISGKIVLASALLLKVKSDRLMDEDISALDALIQSTEEDEDVDLLAMDFEEYQEIGEPAQERPKIYPRAPQPRQRKVSVYDLVTALEQALEVSVRRDRRALDRVDMPEVTIPTGGIDVTERMNALLNTISEKLNENETLHFHNLTTTEEKYDKVITFIPLLHLTNERRVDLEQKEHFGHIKITLIDNSPILSLKQEAA